MDSNLPGTDPEAYRRDSLPTGSRRGSFREEPGAPSERFDRKLDRWVTAGRQIVHGVTGARPGSHADDRAARGRSGLGDVGRWVGNRMEWLMEDADDWREPWQEQAASSTPLQPETDPPPPEPGASIPGRNEGSGSGRRRRPLEAISRRAGPVPTAAPSPAAPSTPVQDPGAAADDWPDDDTFTLPRWQRSSQPANDGRAPREEPERASERRQTPASSPGRRPLPRSSRRR